MAMRLSTLNFGPTFFLRGGTKRTRKSCMFAYSPMLSPVARHHKNVFVNGAVPATGTEYFSVCALEHIGKCDCWNLNRPWGSA
jgi:hypothetical protein